MNPWAVRLAWLGPLRAWGLQSYCIYLVNLPVCVVGHEWLYRLGIIGVWAKLFVTVPL